MVQASPYEPFWTRHTAIVVAGGYAVLGALYIIFSDRLLLWHYGGDTVALTEAQMAKGIGFVCVGSLLLFTVIHIASKVIRRAHQAELDAVAGYQRMIETTNEGVWMIDDDGRTSFVNETMAHMLGTTADHMIAKPESLFLDEHWNVVAIEQLQRRRSGERDYYECKFRRPDGRHIWTIIAASPMQDSAGSFTGVLRMVTDITARKHMEVELKDSLAAQRELLNELDHRVRNNLTSLIHLVDISRSTMPDTTAFAASIRGRIDALNRAHSLLSASGWKEQDFLRLLNVLIPGEHRDRFELDGPTVGVAPHLSGALAMVLHELIMNAARHGALSRPDGRVNVTWSVIESPADDARRIDLQWTESGGPSPQQPVTPGPGLQMIRGLVRSDLRGTIDFDFSENGARHRVFMTVHNMVAASESAKPPTAAMA